MSFNEIFWENGTYDGIKSEKKKKTLHSLQIVYILLEIYY